MSRTLSVLAFATALLVSWNANAEESSSLQLEAAAIGFFGASGELSPGARLGVEARPWQTFGISAGSLVLATSTDTDLADVSGLRIAGDTAATFRNASGSITSSAAVGVRAGGVRFQTDELDSGYDFYLQALLRGRGEWSFAASWFLLFQMELAFAIVAPEAVIDAVVVDRVRSLEADLSLGVGFRW